MVSPDGIGELLRTIRERADRTREQQAKRMTAAGLVCTVENLKRWETERRLPTPVWRSAIRAVYGLSDEQLDQALENTRRHRRQQRMEDDDVKRRKLFTLAAATAGFAVLPGIAQAREGIDTGLAGDGAGDLTYLEGAFERHRGGYNGRAPDAVLGEMREDLALLAAVLRRPHPRRTAPTWPARPPGSPAWWRSCSTTGATRPTRTGGSPPRRRPPASPGTGG